MVTPRRSPALLLWVGVLAATLAPTAVHAQDEDARRLFLQGRELAAEGDWGGALTRWQASFVLVERASTAVSMAHALVRLERWDEAETALDDLERLADPARDSELLSSGRALREEIAAARPATEVSHPAEASPAQSAGGGDGPSEPPPDAGPGFDASVLIGPLALAGAGALAFVLEGVFFALREDAVAARDGICPTQASDGQPRCATIADFEAAAPHASDARTFNEASNAMLGVGLALAAGAVVWLTVALVLPSGAAEDVARFAREGARW